MAFTKYSKGVLSVKKNDYGRLYFSASWGSAAKILEAAFGSLPNMGDSFIEGLDEGDTVVVEVATFSYKRKRH